MNQNVTDRQTQRGYTMIELMVTLAVLMILTTAALPSFRSFIVSQRIKTASFDIVSSLLMARSEAVKRNANVDVTPTNASWLNGWRVAAGPSILKRQDPLSNGVTVKCYTGTTLVLCSTITYISQGRLVPTLAPQSIQINSSDPAAASNVTSRCITIDPSGRPLSKKASCI